MSICKTPRTKPEPTPYPYLLQTALSPGPEYRTSQVLETAKGIADGKDMHLCPVLADALLDAGYANEEVLKILRRSDAASLDARVAIVSGLVPDLWAPKDLMVKIQNCLFYATSRTGGTNWAEGINPDNRHKPPVFRKYATGELVVINSRRERKSQAKHYYVRSYRAGGVGAYRLMREDGRLISASNIRKWAEPGR